MKVFAIVEGGEHTGIQDAQVVLDFEGMTIGDFSEGELSSIKKNMVKLLKEIGFEPHSVYFEGKCPLCEMIGNHKERCENIPFLYVKRNKEKVQ